MSLRYLAGELLNRVAGIDLLHATLLAVEGGVDDLVILQAAILHDTIEATQTTYDELVSQFGREVADVVLE